MAGKKAKKGKAAAGEVTVEPDFDQLPSNELTRMRLNMVGTADQLRGCTSRYRAAVGGYDQAPDAESARHELEQIKLLADRALVELGRAS